jgi:hypothetical protein
VNRHQGRHFGKFHPRPAAVPNIRFFRYQVSFRLLPA